MAGDERGELGGLGEHKPEREHEREHEHHGPPGSDDVGGGGRRSVLPGFSEMSARRREFVTSLVERRTALGLSQTEVAARMGTSQSAVARLEAGSADVRLSTLERYAAALDRSLDIRLEERGS